MSGIECVAAAIDVAAEWEDAGYIARIRKHDT